jgi:uncharacterized repeat protein (TIGR03803 family)
LVLDGGNGSYPQAGTAMDAQGNIYGTTSGGGTHACGTLYRISPSGAVTTLVNFDRLHGMIPLAGVVVDSQGNVYGTTQQGGITAINGAINGFGTLWKYSPTGGLQTLVSFNGANGMFPAHALALDSQGNLFGTTVNGGSTGNGVVFEYSADGVLSTLVDFDGGNMGAIPESALAMDSRGVLYGVTNLGGSSGHGTIFAVQPVITTLAVTSVTLNQGSVAGGGTVQGTVNISGPAPAGGITVTLGSSSDRVTPQGPITIPPGATSAAFTVSTQPVTDNTPVAVSARLGASSLQATLTVNPPATVALALIQVNPDVIEGGTNSAGTVTLNRVAPAGGAVVSLSSNSSLASVPSSVTVPAGGLTANFTIATRPVSSSTSVTITATLGASSLQYNPLLTAPLPYTVGSLLVNFATAQGQTPLIGKVAISRPAGPGGITIALSSNAPSVVVPASVTIPAGVGVASFPISTTAVSSDVAGTITATLGSSSVNTAVNVLSPKTAALSGFTLYSNQNVGGFSNQGTLVLNTVAPASGTTIALSTNSSLISVPATVTVPAGESNVAFPILTSQVSAVTNVVVTATLGGSSSVTLSLFPAAPPVTPTSLALNPASVQGGASSTGTVTLSGIAPAGGTVVTLASIAAATVSSSVTVPPGGTTASFSISTSAVTADTTATITASTGGQSQQAVLTITAKPSISLSAVSISPTTVRSGDNAQGTVTLTGPAPAGGAIVTLSSGNTAIGTVPASVTVGAGKTSATFTVATKRSNSTASLTITAQYGGVSKAATITVTRH